MVRPARLGCAVTAAEYADTLSDTLNADLPDGEPAWSVVKFPDLPNALLVEQLTDPPHLYSVTYYYGRWGAEKAAKMIRARIRRTRK